MKSEERALVLFVAASGGGAAVVAVCLFGLVSVWLGFGHISLVSICTVIKIE